MQHTNNIPPSPHYAFVAAMRRSAAKLGLKSGWIDEARRVATPHVVECLGLTREVLGDQEFEREYHARRVWCQARCAGDHEIEPIRDEQMVLVGYTYRFADEGDAALFKLSFR